MTTITFENATQYAIVQEVVQSVTKQGIPISGNSRQRTLSTDHLVIKKLLNRLAEASPTILPLFGKQFDHWLLVGQEHRALDKTVSRITAFIIPSYAEFGDGKSFAQLLPFSPQKDRLNQLGKQLFPLGYYKWVSPVQYRNTILDRLALWLELEESEPTLELPPQYTYQDLHQRFIQALTEQKWAIAENILLEMKSLNLTTADNLQFLRIQWLAAQEKWSEIWNYPKFEVLAKLRMPRDVRVAMLTAFHHVRLLPLERDSKWQEALTVFRELRGRLGTLLIGRFGASQAPILRVFGYQALLNNNPSILEGLLAEAMDSETIRCLNALTDLLALSNDVISPDPDPLNQALLYLRSNDYDAVIDLIKSIEDIVTCVLLAIEVAYHSRDDLLIQEAWLLYENLSPEQKQVLISDRHYVSAYLNFLRDNNTDQKESIWGIEENQARDAAWKGVCEVEYYLRRLIEERYAQKFGSSWTSKIKTDLREKWEAAQTKDEKTFTQYGMSKSSILDYSYLGDLVGLINPQWSLFENVLGSGKSAKREFTRKVEAIIRVRNPLAHNRDVPVNELRRAGVYCTDLLLMLTGSDD